MDRLTHLREQLAEPVSSETHAAVRKLWIEHSKAELGGDVDGLIATLVPDCCYEILPTGQRWTGHDEARRFYLEFFDAFPDAEMLATDLVIGPQGVFLAAEFTATHLGPWTGIDPTGRRFSTQMVVRFPWDATARKFSGERVWFADDRGLLGALGSSGG